MVVGVYGNYMWLVRDKVVYIQGGLILGVLYMVYERSEDKICGFIMFQGGVQVLEMMLYILDVINVDQKFFLGIILGVLVKDDCD